MSVFDTIRNLSRVSSDGQWHGHDTGPFKVRLIDGTSASGPVMRRKIDGKWQYRAMTDEETEDYLDRAAW